ncbi:cell division site-positioning protein MapZ family protein [Lactococcus raffinolactis]|uniref:Mid-cell-anchored protein Z n=1 Tax=Pseudolactococcus raffinolactis TaxID=1366 RepID=A0A6H0UGU6_9LACT|nr:cell division site-positioning protein MapZ family protein [Lactococcus raffinolactis]MDT2765162.1 cell division site-positioning protein MapZ family protein [Lactococcus raffinolactis]MDT2788686.1 cell division site-positioning protein MapZ family protein [Lactococcus raffinolactis]QIW51263.1 hypothetical protein GU337_04950 [Lactococcus raffinolactis]QIW54003.1 hypothetical protein GU336_07530 [Lactococcus raffinolactis]
MAKKKKKTAYKEKTLAMKDAENLTVEQVSAKSDELETENLTKESSLDKYIRQHRSDIESAKKERQLKAAAVSESLDKLVKTAREAATADSDDSEKEISSEKEDVVENKTTLSDTAVEEVSVQSETVSEIAPVSEPEIPEVTEPVEEAIEPDFPEIQGSFDTVVLAADDDDEQSPGSPALSEKSDEPVSQVDPDPVVTPFASKVSEPTTKVKTPVKVPEMIVPQPASVKQEWSIGASEQETKSHKKPLIIGVCALLLLAVGGTVWYQVDQSNQKQAAQTAKSEAKKSEEAKKTAAFNKVYATFFVDDKGTKLKNDQFDNINKLTSELDKLKDQSDYKTLKAKVDELKSEISAIKAMNGNFDKAIIKDGALDKTAQVRNDAKLSYTATENTALNTLLKDAVTHGQAQQKANASTAAANASTSAANAQPVAPSAPANTTTTPQQGGATTATAGSATGPISSGYGLSTAQYQAQYPNVTIVTSNSRVPVDPNADLSDPAYAWAPGIRELVLQKCRERGYISGDNYILLPASIQKGNGYYNLYKSDGTYLVSINCKTGYFVGNATGHADDLDY